MFEEGIRNRGACPSPLQSIGEGQARPLRIGEDAAGNDMTDIDDALARLRDLPLDPRLDHLDRSVFDALAARPSASASAPTIGIAAGFALAIGFAGSLVAGGEGRAAPVVAFGTPAALAPSSLLGGRE